MRLLEDEVQRLSQTVLDLQSTLTGLTANLQDDTKKMLVTLLNNMRSNNSATTADPEDSPAVLDGHQTTRGGVVGDKAIEKIVARLDDFNTALKSKDDALEDLKGTVTSHEGQLRVLMHTSQSQTPAIAELDVVQSYIDGKFDKLKKELNQNMQEELVKLQVSCYDKIQTVQKTCDDQAVTLTKLVEIKESDLRKEIRALHLEMAAADGPVRTQRQTDPLNKDHSDHKDLWREIDRIAEAHRILNARVDNELAHLSAPQVNSDFSLLLEELEARINVTEQNAETHCFYVEEKLIRTISAEVAALRRLLDERLNSMEDQFTNMLVEISNNSFPGMFSDSMDHIQTQVNNNKFLLQGLDDKVSAVEEICSAGCSSESEGVTVDSSAAPSTLTYFMKDLSRYRNELDVLNTNLNANTGRVKELGELVERQSAGNQRHAKQVVDFQKGLLNLQDNVRSLAGVVTGLSENMDKYKQNMHLMNTTCCQTEQRATGRDYGTSVAPGQIEELRNRLDALSNQVSSELSQSLSSVNGRVSTLEKVCGKLDGLSVNLQEVKDRLEGSILGLRDCMYRMNTTCGSHGADISAMQSAIQKLQSQLSAMARHVLKDVTAKEPGKTKFCLDAYFFHIIFLSIYKKVFKV